MIIPSRLGEVSRGDNPIEIRRGESGVIIPSRLGEVSRGVIIPSRLGEVSRG